MVCYQVAGSPNTQELHRSVEFHAGLRAGAIDRLVLQKLALCLRTPGSIAAINHALADWK